MAFADVVPLEEPLMDLSQVGKTIDGESFAYFQLECIGKKIGSINVLEEYKYLRQIDLSKNCIEDVAPLASLEHLLKLNLAANAIPSIGALDVADALRHLLYLDMSSNKLTFLPPLRMPALKKARFARNQIATCEGFKGHARLEELDLCENQLLSLNGVSNMPMLHTLLVAQNTLTTTLGMNALPVLTTLDLSQNSFESFEGPPWTETPLLKTLNLSSNKLLVPKGLEPLGALPALRIVELASNPLGEEEGGGANVRIELLIFHGGVLAIDGEEVTEEECAEAKALNEDRIEKERQRLAEEAEARRVAEEARLVAEAEAEEARKVAEAEAAAAAATAAEAEAAAAEAAAAVEGEGEGAAGGEDGDAPTS